MVKYRSTFVTFIALLHLLLFLGSVYASVRNKTDINEDITNEINQETKEKPISSGNRFAPSGSDDEYIGRNQKQCFASRNLLACIKYKTAKMVWRLATNANGYFPNEYSRELRDDYRRIQIVHLGEPLKMAVFNDARGAEDDSELLNAFRFLKRASETFGRNHGVQLTLSSDSGIRVNNADVQQERGIKEKKKLKWAVILPIIVLIKIAHLKMKLVTLLLGVIGLNVLLIGGMGWLIHYLKFKTLCKIHPQLVQSHSHAYDSDPAEYSHFVGSSFPGSHYGGAHAGSHEANIGPYASDWGNSKAYSGYNYLDTISQRLK